MSHVTHHPRRWVLIPAGGTGSRMQADRPKQYLELQGHPLLYHTLKRWLPRPDIHGVCVVVSPEDQWHQRFHWPQGPLHWCRAGGPTRALTVRAGLQHLKQLGAQAQDWVLVHDAARPCVPQTCLTQLIQDLAHDPVGGLLALPVSDTLKKADEQQHVISTISREGLWRAQTPQMFRLQVLQQALSQPRAAAFTDEAAAIEALGHQPRLVQGSAMNVKVTYPDDHIMAGLYLAYLGQIEAQNPEAKKPFSTPSSKD